jgi:hypothetical protein
MKRSLVLLLIVAAAAATPTGNATPIPGGTSAVAVLKAEAAYLNARSWRPYYALMGPRFHAQCKYSTFVARNESVRKLITHASIKMIASRVSGSRAYLSYETIAPPVKPFVTKNDLFVEIGGRWFDELDAVTAC